MGGDLGSQERVSVTGTFSVVIHVTFVCVAVSVIFDVTIVTMSLQDSVEAISLRRK